MHCSAATCSRFGAVNGEAENFHAQQNRELLTRIATLTGGRYWRPQELAALVDEISYSPAGITTHATRALWTCRRSCY